MLLLLLSTLSLAALANANYSWCTQQPYSACLSYSTYPQAQSYCSKHYPPGTATTQTVTQTATVTQNAAEKRDDIEKRKKTSKTDNSAGWASCSSVLHKSGDFASACSCIETTASPTVTVTSTTTVTPTTTSTSTSTTSTTSVCTNFYAQATSGAYIGDYLADNGDSVFLTFVSDLASARAFYLTSDNQPAPVGIPAYAWSCYYYTSTVSAIFADNVYPEQVTCTVAGQVVGGVVSGPLSCMEDGDSVLLTCPATSAFNGYPESTLFISDGTNGGDTSCVDLGLIAIPAC